MSGRRRTALALAAVLVVAGGAAGAWALTGTGGDVPVVAAPSDDGRLDASPRPGASSIPSAGDQSEPSLRPGSTEGDVLAGETIDPDVGSGSTGGGGDTGGGGSTGGGSTGGGGTTGGSTTTDEPTSTTSPTATATSSPTSTTTTDPDPPPSTTSSPSPTVQPNRAPTAAYVTRVASGTDSVTFDASSSSDPDSDALTYRWTFNDGTSAKSGKIVTHAFTIEDDNSSTRYTVTLTVTDSDGAKASVSAPSSVSMPNIHAMKMWDASQAVRGAGLNAFYSKVYNGTTTGYDNADVFSQWPAASTTLSGEANVRIAFWASEAECAGEPETSSEWCNEDPPPSPTLDRSYF